MAADFKYWAFISYSHADRKWGDWLHSALETYRVPKGLAGKTSRDGKIPVRVFPIFRDREELSASAELGVKIDEALRQSRYLIVICSPHSAKSRWVNEEIKAFKKLGREDRLLALIVDGEPNASDTVSRGSAEDECFPEAMRFRVDDQGRLTSDRTEPIAADTRLGKDGKANAKLKLIAGLLGVGFDELRQRERSRLFWWRFRAMVLVVLLSLLLAVSGVAVLDAGLDFPGGDRVRSFLDAHEASIFRPTPAEDEIRAGASLLRPQLLDGLLAANRADSWLLSLRPGVQHQQDLWTTMGAVGTLFGAPEASDAQLRRLLPTIDRMFDPDAPIEREGVKLGWVSVKGDPTTIGEPALWLAIALMRSIARPGFLTPAERVTQLQRLAYVQEALKAFRPTESGGWNMFSRQIDPSDHSAYTSVLALMTLLEARRQGLPWEGSTQRRDELTRRTLDWLVSTYDESGSRAGWRAGVSTYEHFDGLALQIYAVLLQAEAEADFVIPSKMLEHMTRHLESCLTRNLQYPIGRADFRVRCTDINGRPALAAQSVSFLWHPWAMSAAALYLKRAERVNTPPENRVRIRRLLGHLVLRLGPEATKAALADFTYVPCEMLQNLGKVK